MTDHQQPAAHLPAPEFRASLEEAVAQEFHRESRLAANAPRPARRLRTPLAIAAGLLLGVGGQFATGQVQRAREKSEQETIINTKRELAGVRLELARSDFELAKKRFDAGVVSRPSLLAAEADLRAAESAAARLNLDLQEVRATAGVPRDELWAPLVGGRDFVKERLSVEAAALQQRIRSLESAAEEAERGFRVGTVTQLARSEAVSVVEESRGEMNLLAQKLMLRRQFLEEQLSPEAITRRLQRVELVGQLQRAETLLRLAEERMALAEKQHASGVARDIEVTRARLDVMERHLERLQLARQLQQLELRDKRPSARG